MKYEKKYREAQKWIESIYSELSHEQQMEAEAFFPELKEGEDVDKKIREEIIATIHLYYGEPLEDEAKEMITWLEKQGEQKPIDKVEPKFKVGDCVVDNCGYVWRIEGILNEFYILEGIDGGESRPTIEWVNNTFHLWDITKDAKDGDVLIDKSNIEYPFIFKETKPSNIKTECLNPLTVLGYCGIGGAGFTKGIGWGDTANCIYYPATKEQRNLLFAKMKEAGYEWNAEHKQLKKIESNHQF